MPTEALTPAPKSRRLTFRRLLLAVGLGLGTWWVTSWWLSPRPLYTLRFRELGSLPSQNTDWLFQSRVHLYIIDDTRFLVLQLNAPEAGQVTVRFRELATGILTEEKTYDAEDYLTTHSFPPKLKSLLDTSDTSGARLIWPGTEVHIKQRPNYLTHRLIPDSTQTIREEEDRFSLGAELDGLLRKLPWEMKWKSEGRIRVGVWDTQVKTFL